MTGVP